MLHLTYTKHTTSNVFPSVFFIFFTSCNAFSFQKFVEYMRGEWKHKMYVERSTFDIPQYLKTHTYLISTSLSERNMSKALLEIHHHFYACHSTSKMTLKNFYKCQQHFLAHNNFIRIHYVCS